MINPIIIYLQSKNKWHFAIINANTQKSKKDHVLCILDTIKIDKSNILGNVAMLKLDRVAI